MLNSYCFIYKDVIFFNILLHVHYGKKILTEICIEIFYELLPLCIVMNMYHNKTNLYVLVI